MDSDLEDVSLDQLKQLVPLFTLSDERIKELAALSITRDYDSGMHIFREGDVDNQTLYLLDGQVEISSASDNNVIAAGTPEANHPISESQPRQSSCVARSPVKILHVDNNVLDYMITWDQVASLAQSPLAERTGSGKKQSTDDAEKVSWMNRMLSSAPFQNVPAANMKDLLGHMEEVPVKAGDVIVRQGEPGDYYYLIESGEAEVTQQISLAELGEGASFGEEALISDTERNATVTMQTDGRLLRLSKQSFNQLLKEPLIQWLSLEESKDMVRQGAVWLDVRLAREFSHYRLPNAVNIPLDELRDRMDELDKDTNYICYCKTGRRSSAASFLLSQAGFNVFVLRGGLQILPKVLKGGCC